MLEVYREFIETELAIPVYAGKKSDSERFAGAEDTYTVEALMKDGKALQAGTSHHLGQHFAKVFDITYQDEAGKRQFVWQTSWGVTTRLIGALVMVHGDDAGLRLPPRVAPVQAVIVPIWRKDEDRSAVKAFLDQVKAVLGDRVRLHIDDRDQYSPGWKYNEYEMRGVPVRLEVGPRDVANQAVMSVRRDNRAKESIPLDQLATRLPAILDEVQATLFQQAKEFRAANTVLATSKDEVLAHFGCGQARARGRAVGRLGRVRGGGEGEDRRHAPLHAARLGTFRLTGASRSPRRAVRALVLRGARVAPARVLVRFPNWLGDVLMARPALHAMRAAWPAARFLGVGPAPLLALPASEGLLEESVAWPNDAAGRRAAMARVRTWGPETAVVLPASFSSAWLAWNSGARVRAGFGPSGGALLLTQRPPGRARRPPPE
jgi:hypothetical protein